LRRAIIKISCYFIVSLLIAVAVRFACRRKQSPKVPQTMQPVALLFFAPEFFIIILFAQCLATAYSIKPGQRQAALFCTPRLREISPFAPMLPAMKPLALSHFLAGAVPVSPALEDA